jgi:hypothetical protein
MSAIATTQKIGKSHYNTKVKTGGGKFCKICKDVGKTNDEYTSHYVRESPAPNSRVVCPTLISSVCRYCKEGGHTVKHCPKIEAKNRQDSKNDNQTFGIISKSYCMPTTHSKKKSQTIDQNSSAYAVLDFSSDEEEEPIEVIVTTPTTKSVVSYASILQKEPLKYTMRSQVKSLIPTKLNFDLNNVVTLDKITKLWADEEDDLDDAIILNIVVKHPFPYDVNHPLNRFVSFTDALASDYTNSFTKSIAITSDAFQQLSKNWEAKFFETEGDQNTMNKTNTTNARARSIMMTERYIR